ncbi:MAG TPA: hypothetical protein DDW23_06645 [Planctomycetes bacterium]|nr:hypothetical protein [Planctomycetota bacterium]
MPVLQPSGLRGRNVLVLGLGSFGGGVGAARHLTKVGARVTATDLRTATAFGSEIAELNDCGVKLLLGGHSTEMFREAEIVVVNPAVAPSNPWLEVAREFGCKLTTEVSLALATLENNASLVVTGTHGKSTCASFAAHLLNGLPGRTLLAGNLGGSLLEAASTLNPGDRLVLELSSFQLHRLEAPPAWPQVAILTVQGEDHLDWHKSYDAYASAKLRLLEQQAQDQLSLSTYKELGSNTWKKTSRGRSEELKPGFLKNLGLEQLPSSLDFPWLRPLARLAIRGVQEMGVSDEHIANQASNWPGLPHRMETHLYPREVKIVDNGIATHPEPTIKALGALTNTEQQIVLLAGGKDKGLPLTKLAAAAQYCTEIHLHGQGGERLANTLNENASHKRPQPEIILHANTQKAMRAAIQTVQPKGTLLFSPSFSSFDEFQNFSERADLFQNLVNIAFKK